MKIQSNPNICSFWFLLFLLLLLLPQFLAQEVEDQRGFDYFEGSLRGPRHWGNIRTEWAACKHGRLQSPIDLLNYRVRVIPRLGELRMNYKPANATIKNRGHDIAIVWLGDAGSIQINGTNYALKQCHWHSPSEHSINGRKFDLELHMVHQSTNTSQRNNIAVLGLLYQLGEPDLFLSQLTQDLMLLNNARREIPRGLVDPTAIRMGGTNYYRYFGSLTVPPCTEGVIWTINKQINTVSREQVLSLRLAVRDFAEINARPIQPINQRDIRLYGLMLPPEMRN
ncbi:hypothetical protein UlMin_005757 [Ulmus minor]